MGVDTGLVQHLNLRLFFASTMKIFGLLPLVAATIGMNLKEPAVVNEAMDMVESGLGGSKEGRALFITLTLTESTWSVTTVTSDVTTAPAVSCIATAIAECTTAATARSAGDQKDISNGPAILVSHTGEEVDVHAIKPTKAQDVFAQMDIDGVIHEHEDPISSGSLSFREVRMENMAKGCGRSDGIEGVDRMPRIVIPSVESKVDTLTKTVYNSTVASTTYTFAIPTSYCTTAGYTGHLSSMPVCV